MEFIFVASPQILEQIQIFQQQLYQNYNLYALVLNVFKAKRFWNRYLLIAVFCQITILEKLEVIKYYDSGFQKIFLVL